MKSAVAYLRVSTKGQAATGLGVDAQRAAVDAYCRANGLKVIDEYVEIESGRKRFRPVLHDAMMRARGTQSILLIARLDRLSRSSRFIGELLDGDVKFVAVDMPNANRLVLQILAAVAEDEARNASIRTKAALAAAKARGAILGKPPGYHLPRAAIILGNRNANALRRRKYHATIDAIAHRIRELRRQGWGYTAIASALNEEQYRTSGGKRWRAPGVWKAYRRLRARGKIA